MAKLANNYDIRLANSLRDRPMLRDTIGHYATYGTVTGFL